MQSQEKSLSDMLAHAGELERDGKPVPPSVKKQIDTLKSGIAEQKRILAKREQERSAMQQSFEAELGHYREIKARQDERKGG
jgi:predicted RNase H-like nuclease (RuvC/YqgF family)